jgi:AcrR family transcriptional regulator
MSIVSSPSTAAGADAPAQRTRQTRAPVTRHDVLVAALGLVDREGLDELSLRKLAAELDVETMSLYKRVASKDDLLAGVAELIWDEVAAAAPPQDDWGAWLRSLGRAIRAAVHNHPRAVPLLSVIEVFPVPLLEVIATQLERASGGWPPRDEAVSAVWAASAFALGTAMTEVCLYCGGAAPADDPAATERQQLRRILLALPDDAPDRLVETALAVCGHDVDDMFTKGLDLIIRGGQPV